MALSIRNRILRQLATDLLAMRVEDGYSRNANRVIRRAPFAADLSAVSPDLTVFIWTEPEVKKIEFANAAFAALNDEDVAAGQVLNLLTVNVAGLAMDDPDLADEIGGEIVADFEQCLTTPNARTIAEATVDISCAGTEVLNQNAAPTVAGGSATFLVSYYTPQAFPRETVA